VNDSAIVIDLALHGEESRQALVELEDWLQRDVIESLQVTRAATPSPGEMGIDPVTLSLIFSPTAIKSLAACIQTWLRARHRDLDLEIRASDGTVRHLRASGVAASDIESALELMREHD
jgi:hypothetical protein